jgi:hypothetical protein
LGGYGGGKAEGQKPQSHQFQAVHRRLPYLCAVGAVFRILCPKVEEKRPDARRFCQCFAGFTRASGGQPPHPRSIFAKMIGQPTNMASRRAVRSRAISAA